MPQAPPLTTKRLKLRAPIDADASFLFALTSDDKVRHFLGGAKPLKQRRADVARYVASEANAFVWIVESRMSTSSSTVAAKGRENLSGAKACGIRGMAFHKKRGLKIEDMVGSHSFWRTGS